MKVLFDNGGQTCNKFWGYLYPLTEAILHKQKYIVPFYDVTIDSYPNLLSNPYFYYPFYSKIMHKMFGINKYLEKLRILSRYFNLENLPQKWPKIFVDGWSTRHYSLDKSAKEEIKRIFLPVDEIVNPTKQLFELHKKNSDLIIGVHIRRGDYTKWCYGRFYYSFDDYASLCKQLISIYKDKNILFFISSNESVPTSFFKGLNTFVNPLDSAVADLYSLSLCNFIFGPPSSFSRFASYYGDVPISFITDIHNHTFDFRTIESYNKYSNGEKVEFEF